MASKITKEDVKDIVEMLEDGKGLEDIHRFLTTRKKVKNFPVAVIHSLITHSILCPAEHRTPEQQQIRDTLLNVLLGESVVKKALRAVSETTEKRSLKVTTLSNLTATEKKSLEKLGYADFVEESEMAAVILKVEDTKEIIPPDLKLLEKLLGLVEGNTSIEDIAKQITPFSPPDPMTPDV